MSAFNILHFETTCPHCLSNGQFFSEFKFAYCDQDHYGLGDKLKWNVLGTEPWENIDFSDEGYVVCPFCDKDFWVTISVKSNVIESVVIDSTKKGYY